MTHICLFLIFFTLGVLCYYTKCVVSSIRFKRKYNIKPSMTSVEINGFILIYTVCFINIGICIWALFNN